MEAASFFRKGNEAYVGEDYTSAIKLYTCAINEDPSCSNFYSNRSHAYIKLNNYTAAKADSEKAIELSPTCPKSHLRLGMACFNLNKFEEAKKAFQDSQKYNESDSTIKTWLKKCDAELNLQNRTEVRDSQNVIGLSHNVTEVPVVIDLPNIISKDSYQDIILSQKAKFDWYQTDSHVFINVFLKNLKKEDVLMNFTDTTLSFTAKQPTGSDYSLELDLAHPIIASQSSFRVIPSKIEVKIKKPEVIRWAVLESDGTKQTNIKHFNQDVTTIATSQPVEDPHKYPSSRKQVPDWEKMAKEVQEEEESTKLEGDAGLNQLFQKIYRDGSDEVKRAMNKSFMESGGTALSTNWKEVEDKKTDVKPPDGLEFRKWE